MTENIMENMTDKVIYDGSLEKVTHKDIFGATIAELAACDKDVVYLDADLMNSSGTMKFWRSNPRQAVNCGVAEANMMGIAAGLSLTGKKPYVHSFGPFASRRCYDQVFLSIGYSRNGVRIFGSDEGVTAAYNGGTHMPFEDMALMRAIPGSTVLDASDGVVFRKLLFAVKDRPGVTYLRSTRKQFKAIYAADADIQIGRANVLREGADVTIIACGLMTGEAMAAHDILKSRGISARVVDMFTVKPVDSRIVAESARATGAIVTAENHNVIGGLADAVGAALLAECASERGVPFERVGVFEEFGQVGPQDYLQEHYGLTAANIAAAAERAVARKRVRC